MVEQAEIDARTRELRSWYDAHYWRCDSFRDRLTSHLEAAMRESLAPAPQVESRTKSVDSWTAKAVKTSPDGDFKYRDPKLEITDAIGLRIVVPVRTDLDPVISVIRRSYDVVEEIERGDEDAGIEVPGYQSVHLVVRLREDERRSPEFKGFHDLVAEVQVRTILQHAWASLQHDLWYKTDRAPAASVKRRLIALAGLLDLADREFVEVRHAHADGDARAVHHDQSGGALSPFEGKVTAASVRHLTETLLGEEDESFHEWFVELKRVLDQLGLTEIGQVTETLGPWKERAATVASTVRLEMPWASSAYVFDLLLRLALRDTYLDKRPPDSPDSPDDQMSQTERDDNRRAFHAELDALETAIAGSSS